MNVFCKLTVDGLTGALVEVLTAAGGGCELLLLFRAARLARSYFSCHQTNCFFSFKPMLPPSILMQISLAV